MVKIFNYLFEIDISSNASQKYVCVLMYGFGGFGCPVYEVPSRFPLFDWQSQYKLANKNDSNILPIIVSRFVDFAWPDVWLGLKKKRCLVPITLPYLVFVPYPKVFFANPTEK